MVSIPAPARGATLLSFVGWPAERVSIHAPARGATGEGWIVVDQDGVSIHAPARGATIGRGAALVVV